MASEAGSFIDDESPELLTLQVASRATSISKDDFKMSPFSFIFVNLFLGTVKLSKKI